MIKRIAALVAVLALAGCGASTTAHPDSNNAGPTASVAAASSPTPSPSCGQDGNMCSSAPAAAPQSRSSKLHSWFITFGLPMDTVLAGDMGRFSKAASSLNFPAGLRACRNTRTAVAEDQASTPVPDAAIEARWNVALSDFARFAADCISGINQQNASLVDQATSELVAGNRQIAKMTRLIGHG